MPFPDADPIMLINDALGRGDTERALQEASMLSQAPCRCLLDQVLISPGYCCAPMAAFRAGNTRLCHAILDMVPVGVCPPVGKCFSEVVVPDADGGGPDARCEVLRMLMARRVPHGRLFVAAACAKDGALAKIIGPWYSAPPREVERALEAAALEGYVGNIGWLMRVHQGRLSPAVANTMLACAATRGHAQVVRMLLHHSIAAFPASLLKCVAGGGHVDVVVALLCSGKSQPPLEQWSKEMVDAWVKAMQGGHVAAMQAVQGLPWA